ncbi:hypothetical protein [Streptomyces sp. NPDC050534]|uniref:hypothetical protein n=1 Tax=Streptomyces sp. NPDC050534 TaxID=3365625 RepID=UPI0037897B1B
MASAEDTALLAEVVELRPANEQLGRALASRAVIDPHKLLLLSYGTGRRGEQDGKCEKGRDPRGCGGHGQGSRGAGGAGQAFCVWERDAGAA